MKTSSVLAISAIFLIVFTISCEKSEKQSTLAPADTLSCLAELDKLISPLTGAIPDLTDEDLESLSYLSNCVIVGMGEATHGTKEFFQLKHRIFKYLVENHGFRVFGFECDMGESYYLDRYVCYGEGNLDNLMNTYMQFWTWNTEEVKELLEWMRIYNESKSEQEKIHYIGFDCQSLAFQPALIVDYLESTRPELVDNANNCLSVIYEMYNTSSYYVYNHYEHMDYNDKIEIVEHLTDLYTLLSEAESDLIAASSEYEYNFRRQLVRNMLQTNDVIYSYTHNEATGYRDYYMAENALWISSLLGEPTKTAIWAHNLHVSNELYTGNSGAMGLRLKYELQDNYQIIGFGFSQGSFTAMSIKSSGRNYLHTQTIDTPPVSGSINELFHNACHDNFIFKFADLSPASSLDNWLGEYRLFLNIGAVYNGCPEDFYSQTRLIQAYDVIIYVDFTTEAVQHGDIKSVSRFSNPDLFSF